MFATRPTLYGTRHAVSAGHYLAAAAGFSVLEGGGNAIDAGCAAGIALGVLLPDLVNVAGVAPILIRKADGTVETIAGLGPWPRSIPADLFMREHGGKIPNGVLRTVVPAAPDAWITALERHGTMGFHDVARMQHLVLYAPDEPTSGATGVLHAMTALVDGYGPQWAIADAIVAARLLVRRDRPATASAPG